MAADNAAYTLEIDDPRTCVPTIACLVGPVLPDTPPPAYCESPILLGNVSSTQRLHGDPPPYEAMPANAAAVTGLGVDEAVRLGCSDDGAALPDSPSSSRYTAHIVWATLTMLLCWGLFGGVALVLAVVARVRARTNPSSGDCLARFSVAVSVAGLIVGCVITAVVLTVLLSAGPQCSGYWKNDACFDSRNSLPWSSASCANDFSGETFYDGRYCYYNSNPTRSRCTFLVGGICYAFRADGYLSKVSCSEAHNGSTRYDEDTKYCYFQFAPASSTCNRGYYANHYCFNDRIHDANEYYCRTQVHGVSFFDGYYCYYNFP